MILQAFQLVKIVLFGGVVLILTRPGDNVRIQSTNTVMLIIKHYVFLNN